MKNLHVTIVLGVRRARSDERVVSRRNPQNLPSGKKKKEILKKSSSFSKRSLYPQPFSAATFSSSSQQPFSAAILSSSSQQLFSAAILSSSSQQLFSAAILSNHSQQLFSAATLSSSSQQPSLGSHSQQLFSAAILSYLAVVRGWWSAIVISYYHHVAVVRGWWSAIIIMLLWSGVGGQLFLYHHYHHLSVVRSWWSTVHTFFRRTLSQRFREQTSTSWSKTESEVISLAHSVFTESVPALVNLKTHEDNQAPILVVRNAFSPKLRYISRTH